MRQLSRVLRRNIRTRGAGDRDGLRFGTRIAFALDAILVALPVILLGVARVAGVHLGIGLYTQLWLLPILVGAIRWGLAGSLGFAVLGLVALNPPIADAVVSRGLHVSTAQWLAQFLFYGVVVLAIQLLLAGRGSAVVVRFRTTSIDEAGGVSTQSDSDRVLASLANTVEIRDHHTQGHCRRVARNAVVMGVALGLSNDDVRTLHWAATLHDLGKIAVPEYILLKSGRLSEEEYAEIRRHPMYGADLLASVSQAYRSIADVVRAHHERWDGLGYPLGLKREEIPRMARLIAVVDVFEALTSERPYRSPMPEVQALQYIKNGAGTQFDPGLVNLFVELYQAGKIECASTLASPLGHTAMPINSPVIQNA